MLELAVCPRLLSILVFASALASLPAQADSNIYRLGPQDKLEVRVYDFRIGSGEAHQWVALNGEFSVNATGSVSLPLLGEVPAADGTTADLAKAIATRLQAKVGLAQLPEASVQVIKYRPFYVIGAVEKAGEYEYRPGLTVLRAVGMASGLERAAERDTLGLERDALSQRGDLRVLAADRFALVVRQARLAAEVANAPAITYPDDVLARTADPDVSGAMREETLLFEARRSALKSQIDTIQQAKTLLTQELTSLAAKDATLTHQVELTRKELSQVSDLVAKGLAAVPRQLAAEQSNASYESSRLDVQLATLRAQQDLAKADRDILELRAKRRDDALTEAAEVRAKLAADVEKIQTGQQLVYQSEVRGPLAMAGDGVERKPTFVLTHKTGEKSETRAVIESDPIEPGDVLQVLLPRRGARTEGGDQLSLSFPVGLTGDGTPASLAQP